MFRFNRKGCARDAILTSRYCIKIPSTASDWRHFLHGMIANDMELRLSKCEDFRHFNRAIFGLPFGLLNIYPLARPLEIDEFFDLYYQEAMAISNHFELAEKKPDSFGFVNGQLKILDYGN